MTEYAWKRRVEEHIDQIVLKKEDANDRVKWCDRCLQTSKKHK